MKRQGDRNITWFRFLGRLHRRTMMGNDQSDEVRRSPPALPSPEYKNELEADIGPTDPDVYQRSPRQPTPYPERIYNGSLRGRSTTGIACTDAAPAAAPA